MFLLEHVTYRRILSIAHLRLEEQAVTWIVGESGSGKSTLLKLLNHMISCDGGSVMYRGESVGQWNPLELRRRVMMVPQTPVMFEGSVRDNLLIGLNLSGRAEVQDDALEQMLARFQVKKQLADSVEQLSGGEQQRVALARVLLCRPETYLLDEPSSALDEHTENAVIETFLHTVREDRASAVIVTHNTELPESLGGTVIVLQHGTVAEVRRVEA